jgi:ectoine hydroxylase-related dioxygenase (phytanoyl-CoA dioxygenase family)
MGLKQFVKDGFALTPRLLTAVECDKTVTRLSQSQSDAKGSRSLLSQLWCTDLAAHIRQSPTLSALIPDDYVAVQCTYFEKSLGHNWLVPLHQDLSIPVAQRVDYPGLNGWSLKEDALYVQAPLNVLQQLVAVRVHLDDCGVTDGALRVVPGSHLHGVLTPEAAIDLRDAGAEVECTVQHGGVLAMRPLLLHSSSKSTGRSRRRVLHYLFGPSKLPFGLQWHLQP